MRNHEDTGCQAEDVVVVAVAAAVDAVAELEVAMVIGLLRAASVAAAGFAFGTAAESAEAHGPEEQSALHGLHGPPGHHACCDRQELRHVD